MAGLAPNNRINPLTGQPYPTTGSQSASAMLAPDSNGRQYAYDPTSNSYSDVGGKMTYTYNGQRNGADLYMGPQGQYITMPSGSPGGATAAQPSNEQRQLYSDLRGQLNLGNNLAGTSSSTASKGTAAATAHPVGAAVTSPAAGAQAGMDAALLRAKEKQGQIARSALTGLHEALGERQMLGSGAEANATSDIAQSAAQGISDVNREQLIQGDENARKLAELTYQGGIQQRGQDITARGQDIQAALGDQSAGQTQSSQYFNQQQAILDALKALQY